MTTLQNGSRVSKNHTAPALRGIGADPSLVYIDTDLDYDKPMNPRHAARPNEFIVSTGSNSIAFLSGVSLTLDMVIASEQETYRHCIEAYHEEMADGRRDPTDTIAGMIDADGGIGTIGDFGDLVVWQCGGRVLAVLVPRLDGSGYEVTKFNPARSHPGPVASVAEVKHRAARQPKPTLAPWRSFKVDRPGGGFAIVVEGHGTTLDDAIAEAVEDIHLISGQGLKPGDHVIIEQDRVVCRVLVKDVFSEIPWNEAQDENDEAIAKATKGIAAAPGSFSPADLPESILDLARLELRDAIDALLGARYRANEAHSGWDGLNGTAAKMVRELDYRADNTCTDAERDIAKALLSLWGIDTGDVQPVGSITPPWTPCGALVEDKFVWVVPADLRGRADYRHACARVRIVDSADLEDEGLTNADWGRLLERPPCRYLVLGGSEPPVVVDPKCHEWR